MYKKVRKAVIPAAGLGTRFLPATKALAKEMLPIVDIPTLDYQVGDKVKHIKFGVGVVNEIVAGGRDYEVTVDFINVGTKKMFASFAKLQKL